MSNLRERLRWAPVRGLLAALASLVLAGEVQVRECRCAAQHADAAAQGCELEARQTTLEGPR